MSRISDSEICTMLGIRFPLFQGGMAWISGVSLAAAVSEAGGLGILTSVGETAESLRDSIRRVREKTRNPFGVNIMLQSPPCTGAGGSPDRRKGAGCDDRRG